jgi:hypothetical protein
MSKDHCVEPDNRATYVEALSSLIDSEIPFLVGGAFAVHFYTDLWRDTRDLDVFVPPRDVPNAVDALRATGFADIGEMAARDNDWIFHGRKRNIMVDVIWRFANGIATVDQEWMDEGEPGEFLGYDVAFVPTEKLIYSKLFTLNRHRCDWPDIMRLMKNSVRPVRWPHLLEMIGEHWLLLAGLIDVFDWQHPSETEVVPREIRKELQRRRGKYNLGSNAPSREELLDPWIFTRNENTCSSAP